MSAIPRAQTVGAQWWLCVFAGPTCQMGIVSVVYRGMQTARERDAHACRAQGSESGQRIRSRADRDVTVLVAEAQRESDTIRGEGDAKRNEIFAEAYGRDP